MDDQNKQSLPSDEGNPAGGQGGTPGGEQPVAPAAGPKCTTCGKDTSGYKCAQCGEESAEHDENHSCGGAMCQPKCVDCGQAESKCNCPPTTAGSGPSGPATEPGGAPTGGAPA